MKYLKHGLLLTLFLGLWLPACDECPKSKIEPFSIKQISAQVLRLTPNGPAPYPVLEPALYSEAAIELTLHSESLAQGSVNLLANFLPQAVACDPVIPKPVDRITKINITAREAFQYANQEYSENADITELFSVVTDRGITYTTIEEFIASDFPAETYTQPQFYLKLKTAPDQPTVVPVFLEIRPVSNLVFQFTELELRVK